jgi:hypothetical protein
MVMIRKSAFIKRVKDITLGSTLSLVLMGSGALMSSCAQQGAEREIYTRGVQSHVTEVEEGVFKITDEQVVAPEDSRAFIYYLDGRTDTLTVDQARQIATVQADTTVAPLDNQNPQQHYRGGGLGNVLYWGALGYMIGRPGGMAPHAGFYANPAAHTRAQQTSSALAASRTTVPVNSRTGFFGKGSGKSSASS